MDDQTAALVVLPLLLAAVAVHALLLIGLSSRHHPCNRPVPRLLLSGVSAAYYPLMYYVLSQMPTYLSSMLTPKKQCGDDDDASFDPTHASVSVMIWSVLVLLSLIFVLFLKAKADMAALAVAAVTSPVAGDDIDSLKIRPSLDSLIRSFWVAGLVVFIFIRYADEPVISDIISNNLLTRVLIAPLWILGTCRMVLRFAAFEMARRSFALGRNVQLIDCYMAWLQERGFLHGDLIVTGERKEDVEKSPMGYRIKPSVLQETREGHGSLTLITVDRVRSQSDLDPPDLTDLCLSFALFKCLRRRFAGHPLAEAGSSWAFHFVRGGLLGTEDDRQRIFQRVANELSFARDFYYSPLPVASLGTLPAALDFVLSNFISALFSFLSLILLLGALRALGALTPVRPLKQQVFEKNLIPVRIITLVLAVVNASTETTEMNTSVSSNWTKIIIIGHYIRCRRSCLRKILSCLLRWKPGKQWRWKHEMGQTEMLNTSHFFEQQSWAHACFNHLSHCIQRKKKHHKTMIKVPPEVEAAILSSFTSSEGQLRDGTDTVKHWWQTYSHATHDGNIAWACYGGEVTTTTDLLLVWHIATGLFGIRYSPPRAASTSSSTATTDKMTIAQTLSRYCAYLVAEAPDLLPDDPAWTKLRYKQVKMDIEEASKSSNNAAVPESDVCARLIHSFSAESAHELLKKGARLGAQLVEAAGERETRPGDEAAVWELLAEFWSEMVLYLAPCDNVKRHLEALQRGGEFITLLWALLLHAGITSRPTRRQVTEP